MRQRHGRSGLITTSLLGLLMPNFAKGKTLLGE